MMLTLKTSVINYQRKQKKQSNKKRKDLSVFYDYGKVINNKFPFFHGNRVFKIETKSTIRPILYASRPIRCRYFVSWR